MKIEKEKYYVILSDEDNEVISHPQTNDVGIIKCIYRTIKNNGVVVKNYWAYCPSPCVSLNEFDTEEAALNFAIGSNFKIIKVVFAWYDDIEHELYLKTIIEF